MILRGEKERATTWKSVKQSTAGTKGGGGEFYFRKGPKNAHKRCPMKSYINGGGDSSKVLRT